MKAKEEFQSIYGKREAMRQKHWGDFKTAWNLAIKAASNEATRAALQGDRENIIGLMVGSDE